MSIKVINPFTCLKIGEYQYENFASIETKAQLAQVQFRSWKKKSFAEKSQLFLSLDKILTQRIDELAKLITCEMGKPINEAKAEIKKCQSAIKVYLTQGEEWMAASSAESDGKSHIIEYRPMGVVLAIMPWNFPYWQFFRCAIPTLLVGNTVLLKHAEAVTGSALMIMEIFLAAGFPAGVMQTIVATHPDTEKLLGGEWVQGLSFTGSTKTGKHLAVLAAAGLKKVVMELGGSDALIVLEDVEVKKAAKIAFTARHQNNGETCIAAKRFFIPEKIKTEFILEYEKLLSQIVFGDPLLTTTTMGPLVNEIAVKNFESMLVDAVDKGAKIKRIAHAQNSGFFFMPALVQNISKTMRLWNEETFAPITPIYIYQTLDEVIDAANDTIFGLGACIIGKDELLCQKLAQSLEAGVIFINHHVKSDPCLPFGGVKSSGLGRELADFGVREFCHITTINQY